MANTLTLSRLQEERKKWRKERPFGFFAKPETCSDGSMNLMVWTAGIPGKKGSLWEDGVYPIKLTFSANYPQRAPAIKFTKSLYHPNVYASGDICLSILQGDWKPSMSMKQLLMGVQSLFDEPNPASPANPEAAKVFKSNRKAYDERIKIQAKMFKPTDV